MSEKKKIAIVGGGVSAMTSAFYLTQTPNWQEKYDITVYQLGWRLGGKGASGRNPEYGNRIQEHGLHIWFGFYANAFKTIQEAYKLWDRPQDAPLATWEQAFKPHSFIVLQELINNKWESWPIEFPLIPGNPAIGNEEIDLWDIIRTAYYWLKQFISKFDDKVKDAKAISKNKTLNCRYDAPKSIFERITSELHQDIENWFDDLEDDIKTALDRIEEFFDKAPQKTKRQNQDHHHFLHYLLTKLKQWLDDEFNEILADNAEIRRLFIMADLGLTILIGMIEDGVLENGFNIINNYDYREWLIKHGANQTYTVDSAPVRGFYDLVFAYENGNFDKPNVEAGTIIRAMLRIALLYKGGVMWKMQAGMGDTIFSPFYEVLKKQGVKFEFFSQVDELIPDDDSITEIKITQQVALKPSLTEYSPLIPVNNLPCWPSHPNYEQLDPVQAQLLKQNNINLESFWSKWPEIYQQHFGTPLPTKTLIKGLDFDKVIFGASVASLKHICPKLLAKDEKLRLASEKIQAVATQAYQVWTNKTLTELGWKEMPEGQEPVMSGFTEPNDTWAAMNQLLIREDAWAAGIEAKNIAYFCSAQPVEFYPDKTDTDFPNRMYEKAKIGAINQLKHEIYWLWPEVSSSNEFDWDILLSKDPNLQNEARFNEQYWRSNIDPSERYVLSVKNSSQYRLNTDGTQFKNLYITGDWIKTGLNAGCVEAATMAGMQTSRAICGLPQKIVGESDFS
ncbi:NAD(P)-binding protein [Catenovulum sp. 2E275]|uniref:NAD(P)-binding protein n=1 Tax=Catenovulum sp. 2E275 TaxID=2980497 RepID=UPI0021D2AFD2|nr:NAD(P)-binding protein [Catenovulum sp. 2E275]MCU4677138.1 NAD(P)-binding protein [Catenovulum sp. 2E275]